MIGYARVSSNSQDNSIQRKALKDAGCSVIREEKVSGASLKNRNELSTILDFIREGDTLVVYKLDRLGRDLRDVLNIVHMLHEKGASLKILDRDIDTSGPAGKLVLTVLGMVAEMERSFIKERQKAGIERAKREGKYKGRPKSIDRDRVAQLKAQGLGPTAIAREIGCHPVSIHRVLKGCQEVATGALRS